MVAILMLKYQKHSTVHNQWAPYLDYILMLKCYPGQAGSILVLSFAAKAI